MQDQGVPPEGSLALDLPAFGIQYQSDPRDRDLSRLTSALCEEAGCKLMKILNYDLIPRMNEPPTEVRLMEWD